MEDLSLYSYLFLGFISICAGFVDAIAGGGGMLTVPALGAVGIPPQFILGTNKLQGSFGSFSSSLKYFSTKEVSIRSILPAFICSFIGAIIGSFMVQKIDSRFLEPLILVMLLLVLLFFIFFPKMDTDNRKVKMGLWPFAFLFGGSIGFYDGFFGPGTGSFFVLAFMLVRALGLKPATMRAKMLNFASNIGALLCFIIGGVVLWKIGFFMAIGQFIGARMGAGMVLKKGTSLIRPMVIITALLMSIKSLFDYF